MKAIEYAGNSTSEKPSEFGASSFHNDDSNLDSLTSSSYVVVDASARKIVGAPYSNELQCKLETVSSLIDVVEATQKEIREITKNSGIWEAFVGSGSSHYRYTQVTQFPRMLGVEFETTPHAKLAAYMSLGESLPIAQKYRLLALATNSC